MGETPTDSNQMQINNSRSTSRIENPSESFIGVHLPEELITEILRVSLRVEPIDSHQMQIQDSDSSVSVVQLPLELITEILMRLPVKSLLKCKCVSKSWLCLISTKQFIRSHYSLSSSTQGEGQFSNQQLLITTMPPNSRIKGCFLDSAHVFDVEFPPLNPNEFPWIIDIVNGLVCLVNEENGLFIWNPALRKSKHLPSPNVGSPKDSSSFNYGFGYDESNDDYTVACVQCLTRGDGYETVVQVYSLTADSWRRIEDFKGRIASDDPGMYVGGKIYWCVESSASCEKKKFVTLDMVSQKYGELQLPGYVDADDWRFGVSGGRLYVTCDYNLRKKVDLWVMNKYGGEESWSKVESIPYVDVLESMLCVVCILRNGEIVLGDGSSLFVYQPKHKEIRNIELDGCDSGFYAFAYVESLLWPIESCL